MVFRMNAETLLAAYARQQKELGLPDIILDRGLHAEAILDKFRPARPRVTPVATALSGRPAARQPVTPIRREPAVKAPMAEKASDRLSRLSRLPGAAPAILQPPRPGTPLQVAEDRVMTFEEKRAVFKELFAGQCTQCPLAKTRHSFVFGAGNVGAPLMIVGEAPGAEEDAQGLPFVGAAGQLLTELLAAIALDRKKDIFITNVIKCRPPGNRTPETAEVAACLPLLKKQIAVVAPRLLLLLGRIAAHALLERPESILKLRSGIHNFRGIPTLVTYHPAAILRNFEYRAPAEEDFRRAAAMLKESTANGASR
jgi:uracil-DNA glycosylase family 4